MINLDEFSKLESEKWQSSYEPNHFGDIFYSLVRVLKPKIIVELGTKAGYSAYYMAKALRNNGFGAIDCYDLWELYEFTSCPLEKTKKNISEFADIISLKKQDVENVHEKYNSVDILHIDLGNHGDMLDEILIPWISKVKKLIIIEGGSKERDNVEWMKKYNKKSINEWLNKNKSLFNFIVIEPFPSITLISPK